MVLCFASKRCPLPVTRTMVSFPDRSVTCWTARHGDLVQFSGWQISRVCESKRYYSYRSGGYKPHHESIVEGSKYMSDSKHMFTLSGIRKPRLLFLAWDRNFFVVSLNMMRRGVLGNVGEELRKVALCDRNQVCIKVTTTNASWLNKRRTILKKLPGVLQKSVEWKGLASPRLRFFFHRTARNEFATKVTLIDTGLFFYTGILLVLYLSIFIRNLLALYSRLPSY